MNAPIAPDRARIVIVDDHALVRIGLRQLFSREADLEVVADVETIREARDALQRHRPDLLVFDLGLGDEFGLGWLPRLREESPSTRILVLSSHAEQLYAERALRAGAHAYLMKTVPSNELLQAVRRVLAGQIAVSAAQQEALLQRAAGHAGASPELSARELEVLRLVADGRSTAEIAEALHRSVKTIESHKQSLKAKLGADSPAQLVRMAIAHFQTPPR